MTWRDDVVSALESIGGQGQLSDIYRAVQAGASRSLSDKWRATVRRELEDNSSDSKNYKGRFDLFYSVNGIGAGVWGLRSMEEATPQASDLETPPRVPTHVYRILRDTVIVRRLKRIHRDACQICRMVVKLAGDKTYSEGHHLKPLGAPHNGPDHPSNIVVLCPNHHVLLDYGAIEIKTDTLRSVSGHRVGAEFVSYHNSQIFMRGQEIPSQTGALDL